SCSLSDLAGARVTRGFAPHRWFPEEVRVLVEKCLQVAVDAIPKRAPPVVLLLLVLEHLYDRWAIEQRAECFAEFVSLRPLHPFGNAELCERSRPDDGRTAESEVCEHFGQVLGNGT